MLEDGRNRVREIVPGGAQAVPVQHRADELSVGEQDRRRAVPRLHHGGVVPVKVALFDRLRLVVLPRLRDGGSSFSAFAGI